MPNNVEEIVQAEFRKMVRKGIDSNIDDIPISELGIDSLDFFETVILLEEEFGIKIPIEKLDNKITLGGILASLND